MEISKEMAYSKSILGQIMAICLLVTKVYCKLERAVKQMSEWFATPCGTSFYLHRPTMMTLSDTSWRHRGNISTIITLVDITSSTPFRYLNQCWTNRNQRAIFSRCSNQFQLFSFRKMHLTMEAAILVQTVYLLIITASMGNNIWSIFVSSQRSLSKKPCPKIIDKWTAFHTCAIFRVTFLASDPVLVWLSTTAVLRQKKALWSSIQLTGWGAFRWTVKGNSMVQSRSHGKAFGVAGPLWGESTGDRWIPLTKGQ